MDSTATDQVQISDPLSALQPQADVVSQQETATERKDAELRRNKPDDEDTFHSSSTTNSYRDEWFRLFECQDFVTVVKQEGKKGKLRSSRFRSVCWKVYLECLPEDRTSWLKTVRDARSVYKGIQEKHILSNKESLRDSAMDPTLNNPLSQIEESPWNKFFQDKDCRTEITQDVVRCFPEIAFFKSERIREMMIDILFCYAKENSHISYKQGMHELLAPLMFVLHSDHQAFLHAKEMESQLLTGPNEREIVSELMDPDYLEHDSYTLFCQLMETAEPWFQHGQDFPARGGFVQSEPFSNPDDCNPSSPLVKKLNRIREFILKKHDYELYTHLSRLDIQPQIYGIRWVRLLFGREFTFQDLIVLWDAIFADSVMLDLVDYIFVAMLIKIRELLLTADYASSLMLLMRYPSVEDIHYLVNKALHIRDPKNNPRQPNYQFQIYSQLKAESMNQRPRSNGAVPKKPTQMSAVAKKTSSAVTQGFNSLRRIGKGSSGEKDRMSSPVKAKTTEDLPHPLAQPTDIADVHRRDLKVVSKMGSSSLEALPSSKDPALRAERQAPLQQSKIFSRPRSSSKKDPEAEQQLAYTNSKLTELQNMCRFCASKMEAHISQMQDGLLQLDLETDDELFVSLAGLKQVKDILNGKLRFSRGLVDSDEIAINDHHYSGGDEDSQEMGTYGSSRDIPTGAGGIPTGAGGLPTGVMDIQTGANDISTGAGDTTSAGGIPTGAGEIPRASGEETGDTHGISATPQQDQPACSLVPGMGQDSDQNVESNGAKTPNTDGLTEHQEDSSVMCNNHPLFGN